MGCAREEGKTFMWLGAIEMSSGKRLGAYWSQPSRNFCSLAAVSSTWRVLWTIQNHARSHQGNLIYCLVFRTWHLGQDSTHLTTQQSSSSESIAWTILQPMVKNVHAEVKNHVLLKQRSPRGHTTFPLMPILTNSSVKGVLTTSFNVYAM